MILLVIGLILLPVGIYMFATGESSNWAWSAKKCWGNALQIAGVVLLVATLIATLAAYTGQVSSKNSIKQYRQNEIIYKVKAENLTTQFRGYLAVQYPKYEQKIFETFTHSPKLLFAAFPQLQASTTLVALVQQISILQNQVYDQEIKISQAQKDMRVRRANPFYLGFLLP